MPVSFVVLVMAISVLLKISYSDYRHRKIYNKDVLLFFIFLLCYFLINSMPMHYFAAFVCLILGFLLFCGNVLGGGDVKLMTVMALGVSPDSYASFIFFVGIFTILTVVFMIISNRSSLKRGIPFAIPLSVGFFISFIEVVSKSLI